MKRLWFQMPQRRRNPQKIAVKKKRNWNALAPQSSRQAPNGAPGPPKNDGKPKPKPPRAAKLPARSGRSGKQLGGKKRAKKENIAKQFAARKIRRNLNFRKLPIGLAKKKKLLVAPERRRRANRQ